VRELILRVGEVEAPAAIPPGRPSPAPEPSADPAHLAQIEALLAALGDVPFRESLKRLLLRATLPPGPGRSQ